MTVFYSKDPRSRGWGWLDGVAVGLRSGCGRAAVGSAPTTLVVDQTDCVSAAGSTTCTTTPVVCRELVGESHRMSENHSKKGKWKPRCYGKPNIPNRT